MPIKVKLLISTLSFFYLAPFTLFTLASANLLAAQIADTVITNANIYLNGKTHNDSNQAIVISNGKIAYIGDNSAAEVFLGDKTDIIDLQGATLLPGFIDNHNHVFEAASEVGGNCELNADATLEEQVPYLKECKRQAKPDQWVIGYGFTIGQILNDENQTTPLAIIDAIFPDQPVIIMEQTSHSMWVNSKALALANIDKFTQEPQGGKILTQASHNPPYTQELNGILFDNAGDRVMELAWNSLKNNFNNSYQGLMYGLEEAAANGITTIGDGRLYWKRGWLDVWQEAQLNGDLTARVSLRPWIYPQQSMDSQLEFLQSIRTAKNDGKLIVNQVKMYSDGIIVNGTAKLLKPYEFTYIEDEPFGINYISPDKMKIWLTALSKINYGAHIHAIGTGAVNESLNAINHVRTNENTEKLDLNYTLTHVELVDKNDIKRFKKLNVTADFQVGSDYIVNHEHQWAADYLGKKRASNLMNIRPIYNSGANLSLSSDWNVNDINPLVGIANSILMGSTGLPNIEAAIAAYTINPAISLGLEKLTGSIALGKSADFVVLDQDITKIPTQKIKNTNVLMTILEGKVVFDADHK